VSRGALRALAPALKQDVWPDKFRAGLINKYDGSSNPKEFIQVYHMVIEVVGGYYRVKANYLPTTLSGVARSWLIKLSEGTIYN
jgi:predicted ATP-binding protein involved in virulence